MKVFVVLSAVMALATAKPQGYSYNQPSFGGSSLSGSSSNTFSHSGSSGGVLLGSSLGSLSSGGGSGFGTSGGGFSQGPSFSVGPSHGSSFSTGPSHGSSFSSGQFSAGPSFSAPAPSFAPSFAPSQSFNAPAATIQKHIYVHVPPVDHEELQQQQQVAPIIQRQKHYKIIFIKAPEAPSISHQLIQQQQQINEEKTLVYVLVKKPESYVDIQPQIQQPIIPPSKPEVYFIKYKAQKEHVQAPQYQSPAPQQIALPGPAPQPIQVQSNHVQESFGGSNVGISSLPAPQVPSPVYGPGH